MEEFLKLSQEYWYNVQAFQKHVQATFDSLGVPGAMAFPTRYGFMPSMQIFNADEYCIAF